MVAVMLVVGMSVALPLCSGAKKKKAAPAAVETGPRKFPFDPKKLAWPSPPNIARIHWMNYFAGAKVDYANDTTASKPKASWMDRLAGGQSQEEKVASKNFPFQL